MKVIKKSVAEQNKDKGSNTLILVPHRLINKDNVAVTSLLSLDYVPVNSKSNFYQEMQNKIQDTSGDV